MSEPSHKANAPSCLLWIMMEFDLRYSIAEFTFFSCMYSDFRVLLDALIEQLEPNILRIPIDLISSSENSGESANNLERPPSISCHLLALAPENAETPKFS